MSDHPYGLGRRKDPEDGRDLLWRRAVLREAVTLPVSYRRRTVGPVLDQGDTPQCVAYSHASLKMMEEWYESHVKNVPGPWYRFEAASFYALCKKYDGYPDEDGTDIRTAMRLSKSVGMRANARWKYGKIVAIEEKAFPIASYVRLTSTQQIKEAVHAIGPVQFGMDVDEGIFDPIWKEDGCYCPPPNGEPVGGHAMLLTGWDDKRRAFRVKNSWGHEWGDAGMVWMPYSWFDTYNAWDAWRAIDLVVPVKP